jgi:hypothetical protein
VPGEPEPALAAAIRLPHGYLRIVHLSDRLAQELVVSNDDQPARTVLRSVDLDPAEPGLGPTSPVFQEPHVENDEEGQRLMLVGQWAKVHFSGVIDHRLDRPDELKFGIAARVRQPGPLRLASTFTLLATAADLRNASDSMVEIAIAAIDLTLCIEAAENSQILLAEAGRAALRLQIMPKLQDPVEATSPLPPRTICWDYTVRLVPAT